MIGLFIGPVLLARLRLYDAWVQEVPPPPLDRIWFWRSSPSLMPAIKKQK